VGAALQQPLVAVCRCCAPANTGLLCCGPPLAVRNSAAWRWQRLRRGHRHQQLATATPSPTASAAQQRAAQRTAVTPKARQQCSWPSQLGHAKRGRARCSPPTQTEPHASRRHRCQVGDPPSLAESCGRSPAESRPAVSHPCPHVVPESPGCEAAGAAEGGQAARSAPPEPAAAVRALRHS
jgi:hypothetical protein